MTQQENRLPDTGRLNRSKPLTFTFDGQSYQGFEGDCLASALIANGVTLMGRSFKYHRPRGLLAMGVEEPNALMMVGEGADLDPNNRASVVPLTDGLVATSQNRFPSLAFDVGAVNGAASSLFTAGFYYKTFMELGNWGWNKLFEPVIRKAAGLGKAPSEPDQATYEKVFAFADVLVVGAGPAGLMAAKQAGLAGARVMLVEQDVALGGSILWSNEQIGDETTIEWVAGIRQELKAMDNVEIFTETSVVSFFDHNYFGVWQRNPKGPERHRFHKVRVKEMIIATGAFERPMTFAGNDTPGVMLASAVQSLIQRYEVAPGKAIAFAVNNDGAYRAVLAALDAGIEVPVVVDARENPAGPNTSEAQSRGVNIVSNAVVTKAGGGKQLAKISYATLSENDAIDGDDVEVACDCLAMSNGWNPAVHLHCQGGGKLDFDDAEAKFVPGSTGASNRYVSVGAANGQFSTVDALRSGAEAGQEAAKTIGKFAALIDTPACSDEGQGSMRHVWLPLREGARSKKAFVDFQNDVTAADLILADREGMKSVEHIKRFTTLGMATDQGKTSNINALGILANHTGQRIPDIGTTTFRPPFTPITFGAIAGRDVRDHLDPARVTPLHAALVEQGAKFEDVGQWKRAWYFPLDGEDMHAAVQRESKAVRDSVGMMDASTLGKIVVKGPDAGEFLDRVYTNKFSTLKVGRCRYGLMLGDDGMIFDDGVTSRIAEDEFLMTTTTGGAPNVLGWLEDNLQTEWADLKVYLTSVTEQWATTVVAGPNARKLMEKVTSDCDLSNKALPFMSWTSGVVADVPARIFRISFSGESAFEVNVPADYGEAVWRHLLEAGQEFDCVPYGTETMHLLRGEKGFIIVGQDTDGAMTPHDMDMSWIVSKKKPFFIGKRSLARPDIIKTDRKQLVGLLTENPDDVLPEGAHLVDEVLKKPPMKMIGHVTSSYFSPNCGRSIAMAMVKGGLERKGDEVSAPLLDGRVVKATITDPVFFDKEGERQNA